MESVLRRTDIHLETLSPPMRKLSSFSSYMPCRVHLDSSSYRSLVCILSHCVDHSLVPPSPEPESNLSVKDLVLSQGRGELHQDQEAGANTDGGTSSEKQEGDCRADGGEQGVSAASAELVSLVLSDFHEKEIEACVSNNELQSVMLECGRLIDAPNEERSGESHVGIGHEEIVHSELWTSRALVNDAELRVSHLGEVLEVHQRDERVPNALNEAKNMRKMVADIGDLVSSEPVEGIDCEKTILVETQDENSKGEEERGEKKNKQTCVYSSFLVNYSGLRSFKDDQLRTLAHQIDGAEVEEGEISDDAQDLEDLVDIDDNEKVLEVQRKEERSRADFNEVASTTICIHKKKVTELGTSLLDTVEEDSLDKATQNKQKCSMLQVTEVREKKKTLTEERKAKKKIAKKRKRALKNREQGVKKLKLHAIVKRKEVKYCNFYRMGRCQQGDSCKFSHDTIPLTKSMPCKYFACNSCLKGDDCPYDHELSKYSCINYMSTGSCNRGDRCKFSHKIPTTDASSQLTVSKMDLHFTSEQPKLRNLPVGTHPSPFNIGSFEGKTKETPPLNHKPLKEANQVPKGLRFISFETLQTDLTNKVKESLPVNMSRHTGAYNHQKQDVFLVHGHQSALTLSWSSLPNKKSMKSNGSVGDVSSNGFAVNDSGNVTKGSPVTHPGGIANHDISEATKILEEFLFCGEG